MARILSLFLIFIFSLPCLSQLTTKGHFEGTLILQPNPDGRNMTIVQRFSYIDWEGHTLIADPGFVSDGATIPQWAWSFVGGPWDGKYRNAAVIHDVGCISHKYSWQVTDRLFYEAMIDSTVSKPQALTMYYAVLIGGPRWELLAIKKASTKGELDRETSDFIHTNAQEKNSLASLLSDSKIEVNTESSRNGNESQYQARIYEVLQSGDSVSKDELNNVLSNAEARESSSNPMTPDDIDDLVKIREKTKSKFVMQQPSLPTKPS